MNDNELLTAISGMLDKKIETINDHLIGMGVKIASMDTRINTIEETITSIEESVGAIEGRVCTIEGSVGAIEGSVGTIEGSVGNIEERVHTIERSVDTIESRAALIDKRVTSIEMTLENETNKNIKVIAEGHLDLSRKLNEAVRIASDIKSKQEIQDIYLNMHESKLRNII